MKLALQIALLAAFVSTMVSAQMRGNGVATPDGAVVPESRALGKRKDKSFAFSSDEDDPDTEGTLGCRQECSDKRFTLVCDWEAFKKKSKKSYKSHRRLGETLDFEDDNKEDDKAMVKRETTEIDVDGRRLTVELDHVECILGVGKKDSYDSSEDYEEYKERIRFPGGDWKLTIEEATVNLHDEVVEAPDYYKFNTKVTFEDIEDPNNSADEITITGEIEIELLCVIIDGKEKLVYDDSDIKFSC